MAETFEAETMSRPNVEVADIFRAAGNHYLESCRQFTDRQQRKVMRAITGCRTAALGGHIDVCTGCGEETGLSFNSCRDRHCPKCQAQARQRWLEARQSELLPIPYFHVVFTLPHQLHPLIRRNQAALYTVMFRTVAATLKEVAANPKRLGAQIGFFAILHTWSQNLLFHPHLHCVVPAGGLDADHTRWVQGSKKFFLPIPVLRDVFRGKFVDALQTAFDNNELRFSGSIQFLKLPRCFRALIRSIHTHHWVVYVKPPFGGPKQVLRYLGRYTHRVAISNHRLISFDDNQVQFHWRDYRNGNTKRKMTLTAEEFIRRFLLHVLPKRFVRIRYFGIMANAHRKPLLALCREFLSPVQQPSEKAIPEPSTPTTHSTWTCPSCGGLIRVLERLSALQIALRERRSLCTAFNTS